MDGTPGRLASCEKFVFGVACPELVQHRGSENMDVAELEVRSRCGRRGVKTTKLRQTTAPKLIGGPVPVELAKNSILRAKVVVQSDGRRVPVEQVSVYLRLANVQHVHQEWNVTPKCPRHWGGVRRAARAIANKAANWLEIVLVIPVSLLGHK
jgi:hypothetical protein